jgi:peptide-methionine (S)-S-oxide reductase
MSNRLNLIFVALVIAATLACNAVTDASADVIIPDPIIAAPPATDLKGEQIAVFAGGCFWGVEAVFEHVKGVTDVTSGYVGGDAKTANYEAVSGGDSGHAEAVRVSYDSSQVSYEQLLKIFFSVVHDPTELNRQGPDTGTQYRSAIFYTNDEQKRIAQDYIAQLDKAKVFKRPIVTQVAPLDVYYKAENYHQDYLVNHPNEPYIVIHDKPKVANLRKQFPELYK